MTTVCSIKTQGKEFRLTDAGDATIIMLSSMCATSMGQYITNNGSPNTTSFLKEVLRLIEAKFLK